MNRWLIISFASIFYYVLAVYGLFQFDAGLVITSVVLFGFPSVLLAHYSYAPAPVILSVASLGLGLGILLEGIAHIYGLWYTLGFSETRLFGLVPFEVLISYTFQVTFLALLYEMFFDDGKYTLSSARHRMVAFVVFAFSTLTLLFIHQVWFTGVFLSYSYVWIIGIIAASCLATLGVYRIYSVRFFDRITQFTLLGAVPCAMATSLAITNSHKFFANPDQYLFTLNLFGEMIPIEEIMLIFALPFLVATIYELYLDDRS